jgi:hypothetical protein
VPLEIRDLGAGKVNILSGPSRRLFLLNLQFHDVGRVLNDFMDVRPVTRANFPQNTLPDPDNTSDDPVALGKHKSVSTAVTRIDDRLTQKTPIVLNEQNGGLSG